jgi:DNA-binding NtrC family response regulator
VVKVLIVEDEEHARTGLTELVESWGYRATSACDGAEGLEKVIQWSPDLVVTDLKMPRMDGMDLLGRITELPQRVAVVMLTAQGSIGSAVAAMRLGAFDYLPKPVDPARLKAILHSATLQKEADAELEPRRRSALATGILDDGGTEGVPAGTLGGTRAAAGAPKGAQSALVGTSAAMREIFKLIARVAPSNVAVLVTGESGTGKELVSRALHELSGRRNKPFVAVNCAAIPETLIESEIFGHEKGAFTGAVERRAGCFELAEDGTLLLDEIAEMPLATQAKLLRVLEDRRLRRLGSKEEMPINVRVVAATNKDPEQAVAAGELRGDLFYRLNVFNIQMPPLREHLGDVKAIAEKIIADMNERHGCNVTGMTPRLVEALTAYRWPGNVRELRNTIERAVILAGIEELDMEHLPPRFGESSIGGALSAAAALRLPGGVQMPGSAPARPADSSWQRRRANDTAGDQTVSVQVGTTVDELERQLILKTLESTNNNKTRAAELLGISSKTLQNKLKEYASAAAGTVLAAEPPDDSNGAG